MADYVDENVITLPRPNRLIPDSRFHVVTRVSFLELRPLDYSRVIPVSMMLQHRRDITRVDSNVTLLASHSRFYRQEDIQEDKRSDIKL